MSPLTRSEMKAKQPQGVVTGTVFCADTNLPARLARIVLIPVKSDAANLPQPRSGETDLNGRFAVAHVPEGMYRVSVMLPGYVDLMATMTVSRLKAMSAEERTKFESRLTTVTLSPNQTASLSLRIERGAEIDGIVLCDDGSPAISLQVSIKPSTSGKSSADAMDRPLSLEAYAEGALRKTDDHGRFRILGVSPGEYLVSVTLPTTSANSSSDNGFAALLQATEFGGLVVYSGDTLRASKAKVIKVTENDTTKDADITVPLGSLHSIRGSVILKNSGLPPPTAELELLYADTNERARIAVAIDGHFELPYVAQGSYILRGIPSAEKMPSFGPDEGDYEPVEFMFGMPLDEPPTMKIEKTATEFPVTVKDDVEGLTIAVPDPPAKPATNPAITPGSDDATQVVIPQ